MQVYRWKAVNMSLEIFPNGEDEREDAEESFGMRANLSFIAIHKARTTDFWVSPPSHHCRRPKGGARGLAQAGVWTGLGFPATLYSRSGVGVGLNQNVGKLGQKWTSTIQQS